MGAVSDRELRMTNAGEQCGTEGLMFEQVDCSPALWESAGAVR
jgi:hypothetical protein